VRQAISVFKKRTGPHERSIRQLTIDADGFAIGEPLREFRGIMSGLPHLVSPAASISSASSPERT
jgi:circadian clock protein KaiC